MSRPTSTTRWRRRDSTVRRVALYVAREAEALPQAARAALQARSLDVATFFSPRAGQVFARLVDEADLGEAVRDVTALAISPAATEPLAALPFRQIVAAGPADAPGGAG